jgi:NAD(P)-dependent dehydrogenase (short-subunit alcohol dehydrogenase family)
MDSAPRIWFHTRVTEGKMSSYDFLDFRGKAVLVTGAATGIGRAVPVGFASPGAMVAIGDINEEAARETLELVRRAGSEVLSCGRTCLSKATWRSSSRQRSNGSAGSTATPDSTRSNRAPSQT